MNKKSFLFFALVCLGLSGCFSNDDNHVANSSVNAALVKQYTLTANSNQTGSPYQDGQMIMGVLSAGGGLTLGQVSLANPVVEGIELVWTDAASSQSYRLSNNETGVFNEINISDANGTFLSQLVEAVGNGSAAQPKVNDVQPKVAISGGQIYLSGTNLADANGQANGVRVFAEGEKAGSSEETLRINLSIVGVKSTELTIQVPSDLHERLVGAIRLLVELGEVSAEQVGKPIYVVEDSGFGGPAEPGKGLFGTVYALEPNTPVLPDLDNACKDATVINDEQRFRCPHTSIVAPNLDVPTRSFVDGFPGLGDDLVEWFAIRFEGELQVQKSGEYGFMSCSDDGSNLYIETADGFVKVIDNDGIHGYFCRSGVVSLNVGNYRTVVDYFQGPRTEIALQLFWTVPGGLSEIIPSSAFKLAGSGSVVGASQP